MQSLIRTILAILLTVLVTGCAAVSLESSANFAKEPVPKYKKLLVVGITEHVPRRQVFEEVFADQLAKQGVVGIPSYPVTGVKEKLSKELVAAAIKTSGADGVITTRLVSMKDTQETRSGFIMTDRGVYSAYGAKVYYASFVQQPVEVTLSTEAAIENNLFDAGSGEMIWSGTSSAVNPEGLITITTELADLVIKALTKDGLL